MQCALSIHVHKTLPIQHKTNHTLRHHRGSPRLQFQKISCSRIPNPPPADPAPRKGWKVPQATVVAGATTVVLACTFGAMYLKNGALAVTRRPSSTTGTTTITEVQKPQKASKTTVVLPLKVGEQSTLRNVPIEFAYTEKKAEQKTFTNITVEGASSEETTPDCSSFLYSEPRTNTKIAMAILYEILLQRQSSSTSPEQNSPQLFEVAFDELCFHLFQKMNMTDSALKKIVYDLVAQEGLTREGGAEQQEKALEVLRQKFENDPTGNYDLGRLLIQIYINLKDYYMAKQICESILSDEDNMQSDPRPSLYMAIIDMMLVVEKMLAPETTSTKMLEEAIENALQSWKMFRDIYKNVGIVPGQPIPETKGKTRT